MLIAITYSITYDNKRYQKAVDAAGGFAAPEARLPACIVGGCALPIGLFWFAWTNSPSLPWAASMAAGIPFGFGMVLVFLGLMNYLIDAYTIFAASVLAANSVLRSCFGAAFPLFTTQMYSALGIHWASSIPAFLALACVPFPFLFYKYGAAVRTRCKYAAESDAFMKKLREESERQGDDEEEEGEKEILASDERYDSDGEPISAHSGEKEKEEEEEEHEGEGEAEGPRFEEMRAPGDADAEEGGRLGLALRKVGTGRSMRSTRTVRDENGYIVGPFDIDRVNTRESFRRTKSRASTGSGGWR
ncbi:hypothetical protein LTS18_012389 [Coniosporium uncinatum]|uniref:Uncharacterized protein n=1 Tax=Coniosporium uncinatum TaxID=93489 RepID=A0ACC3CXF4_9PEZI|nr:hypothetical protein LTS18_012389 [Coniosporium uncinatum]